MIEWLDFPKWWRGVKTNADAIYRPTNAKVILRLTWLTVVATGVAAAYIMATYP